MAVNIEIQEKEQLNELLGTILAWTIIAGMIGKILGIKFNFDSDERMTQWGMQLGDAFKFSRKKLKETSLSPDLKDRVDRILSTTDSRIRRLVENEYRNVRARRPADPNIDTKITDLCDTAVNQIDSLIKDRRHAQEFVEPLRRTFNDLRDTLHGARVDAVLATLRSDPGLRAAVHASLGTGATPALENAMIEAIANRIARATA